jgi:hypothetical protein
MKKRIKLECEDCINPVWSSPTPNRTTYMLTLKTQSQKINQFQTSLFLIAVAPGNQAKLKMEECQ